MPRRAKPPSQTWRTFLQNHVADLVSVDFFVAPTVTFRVLYVFVVLLHHRRRVVHFNVTDSPTAAWTVQQIIEAFPHDSAPRFLLRDRDSIYSGEFSTTGREHRDRRGSHPAALAVAEPLRRARDRHHFDANSSTRSSSSTGDTCVVVFRNYFRYYHGSRTH